MGLLNGVKPREIISQQKRSGETSAGTRPVRPLNFAAMRIPVNQTNVCCPCGKTSSARLIEYGEVGETRRDARKTPALHLLLTRWAAIGSSWMARETISNSNTFRGKNSVPPCSVDEILKLVSIGYQRKSRRDTRSFVRNVQEIHLLARTFRSHFNIFNRRLK